MSQCAATNRIYSVFVPIADGKLRSSGGAYTGIISVVASIVRDDPECRIHMVLRSSEIKDSLLITLSKMGLLESVEKFLLVRSPFMLTLYLSQLVDEQAVVFTRGPFEPFTFICIFFARIRGFKEIWLWSGGTLRAQTTNGLKGALKLWCFRIYEMLGVRFVFSNKEEIDNARFGRESGFVKPPVSRFYGWKDNKTSVCVIAYGVYVGRDDAHKQLGYLPWLLTQSKLNTFLVVGQGEFEKVTSKARGFGVSLFFCQNEQIDENFFNKLAGQNNQKSIWFLGWREYDEVATILKNSSVYLSISISEGLSNSVVDATFFNIPIVALKNNGLAGDESFKSVVCSKIDEVPSGINSVIVDA